MSWFGWSILAAMFWGLAPLVEKAGLRGPVDPLIGVMVRSLGVVFGILVIVPFLPRIGQQMAALPAKTLIFLSLGGLLASIGGQICFYRALKTGPVSQVVPIGAAYPILSFALGILFLGEALTPGKLAGIALVVSGVYLLR